MIRIITASIVGDADHADDAIAKPEGHPEKGPHGRVAGGLAHSARIVHHVVGNADAPLAKGHPEDGGTHGNHPEAVVEGRVRRPEALDRGHVHHLAGLVG